MKRIIYLLLLSPVISFGQCDFNFDYVNTGTNMTAFFTPSAASAIHAELGDGVIAYLLILIFAHNASAAFKGYSKISSNG